MKNLKRDVLVFIIIVLINSAFMLIRPILNLDELWNYNFAINIANGLLPFKDFNIIVTPLYPAIVSIFLTIFGNQLIVTRILGILLFSGIVFVSYKLIDKLVENKWIPVIVALLILVIFRNGFAGDYNWMVLLITLLVIYLELKNNKEKLLTLNIKYDLIVGILVGTSIVTKQTTGLILAFTFVMYKWLTIKNKNDLFIALKISITRAIGVIIPVLLFISYLLITNTMSDFIDYAIKGIATFNNSFTFLDLIKLGYKQAILAISFIICLVLNAATYLKKPNYKLMIMLIYSLQNIVVMYPLCDPAHFLMAALPTFLTAIYCLYLIFNKHIDKYLNILFAVITVALTFFMIVYSIFALFNYIKYTENDLNHFWKISVTPEIKEAYGKISDYVVEKEEEGYQVYILNECAIFPMILSDKYHKDFDMALIGNLGSKGEDGLIAEMEQKQNAIYIVLNHPSRNEQSSEKIRKYIVENYKKIDTIYEYSIYTK